MNNNNNNYISFIIFIILVIIIFIILKYFNKIENFTTTIYTTGPLTSPNTLYNFTCIQCPSCPSGKKRINCSTFSVGECIGCTDTCPTGKHRKNCIGISPGDNANTDITCMPCPDCPKGEYRDGCSNTSEGTCQPCQDNCSIGQYRSGCSGTSQGNCINCDANYNADFDFKLSYDSSSFIKKKIIDNNYYSIIFENDGVNNQSEYDINFQDDTICDILIVGGGGGGGQAASGGGAGACIVYKDYTMNGKYTIKVGRGGKIKHDLPKVENGFDSEIIKDSNILFRAKGGGNGKNNPEGGGCGGGAYGLIYPSWMCDSLGNPNCNLKEGGKPIKNNVLSTLINGTPTGNTNDKTRYIVYGSNGGNISQMPYHSGKSQSAGGGGISENGHGNMGPGGNGRYNFTINDVTYTFKEYFGITGHEVEGKHYIGGGGGGGNIMPGNNELIYRGGLGGGGNGGNYNSNGNNGYSYGAGGGGGGRGSGWYGINGGEGFGGVIVIKYKGNCEVK